MPDEKWNPVSDVRTRYPGLKDWSDDRILNSLSDPQKFRSAFPEYSHLDDERIKNNIASLRTPTNLTKNTINPATGKGYGLYTLYGKTGKGEEVGPVSIPFNKVPQALASGFTWYEGSEEQYKKDVAAEGKTPTVTGKIDEWIKANLQPEANTGINPARADIKNVARAAGRVLYGTPEYFSDLAHAAYDVYAGRSRGDELIDLLDPFKVPEGLYNQFQEDWAKDHRLAVQNLIGSLVGMGITAELTHGALKYAKVSLPELRLAAEERARKTAQGMVGVGPRAVEEVVTKEIEKAGKKRLETVKSAKEAAEKYTQEVKAAKEKTKKTVQAHQDRLRTEKEIEDTAKTLADRLKAAKAKADAENDQAWDVVRKKTTGKTTDIAPLKQVVETAKAQADPTSSPLFRSILNEGEGALDEQGRPKINGQSRIVYADGKEVPISDPNYERFYEMQFGEPPPVNGLGGATSFSRLQRWYSYINNRMYSGGRLEPGTYNALKMTRNAINNAMENIAKESGAAADLAKARKMHMDKMEAFYDSPNVAATTASKSLQETAPEFQKELGIKGRRTKLAAYDPQIQSLSEKLDKLREAHSKLPKETPLRKQITPLPERPAGQPLPLPDATQQPLQRTPVNVQELTKNMIRNAASRWRQTSQYQVRRLAVSGIGGAVAHIFGYGAPESAGVIYLASEFFPKLAASLVERPNVIEWLSRPSAETLETLRSLPNADRIKIAGVFNEVAKQEQDAGRPIHIAPAAATFVSDSLKQQPTKTPAELRAEAAKQAEKPAVVTTPPSAVPKSTPPVTPRNAESPTPSIVSSEVAKTPASAATGAEEPKPKVAKTKPLTMEELLAKHGMATELSPEMKAELAKRAAQREMSRSAGTAVLAPKTPAELRAEAAKQAAQSAATGAQTIAETTQQPRLQETAPVAPAEAISASSRSLEPTTETPSGLKPTAESETQKAPQPPSAEAVTAPAVTEKPELGKETAIASSVREMPMSELHVDPQRFQYKLGTDVKGTTRQYADTKWNPDLAGVISVWTDPADGKTYVINGHHRFELAQRHNVPSVSVRILKAADAAEARKIGALQNIAEGKGTALDAAKFFRDTGEGPESLKKQGITLSESKTADGLALSRLDPRIFDDVVSGKIKESQAVAIGNATDVPEDQEAILRMIEKSKLKVTDKTIDEMARLVKGSGTHVETQESLFGPIETSHSLALEKADVSSYIQEQIKEEKRLSSHVADKGRAARLNAAGNKVDAPENAKVAANASQAKEVYDRLSTRAGKVNDILEKAASELAEGKESPNAIKSRAYEAVRIALAEELRGAKGSESE
jgi:hypothetical protein